MSLLLLKGGTAIANNGRFIRHRSNYVRMLFLLPPTSLTESEPKTCGLQAK